MFSYKRSKRLHTQGASLFLMDGMNSGTGLTKPLLKSRRLSDNHPTILQLLIRVEGVGSKKCQFMRMATEMYLTRKQMSTMSRRKIVQICTLTITLSLVHENGCFLKIMDSQIKDSQKPIARQSCVNNLQCTSLDEQ